MILGMDSLGGAEGLKGPAKSGQKYWVAQADSLKTASLVQTDNSGTASLADMEQVEEVVGIQDGDITDHNNLIMG